jgi:hypothetical protein
VGASICLCSSNQKSISPDILQEYSQIMWDHSVNLVTSERITTRTTTSKLLCTERSPRKEPVTVCCPIDVAGCEVRPRSHGVRRQRRRATSRGHMDRHRRRHCRGVRRGTCPKGSPARRSRAFTSTVFLLVPSLLLGKMGRGKKKEEIVVPRVPVTWTSDMEA